MQLTFMEKLVQEATKSLAAWELWISATEKANLEGRMKDLKAVNNKLEARGVEFVIAQRIAEEKSATMAASMAAAANMSTTPAAQTMPVVRIKPTSLPRFHGCKRNFHRWKRDWEPVQWH